VFEVEQKYQVEKRLAVEERLLAFNAKIIGQEVHEDVYYSHPSRDFRESGEALRIRKVNGVPMVTYKGPRMPGKIKVRKELEWRLDPGDARGSQMAELLESLGFGKVAAVCKIRDVYRIPNSEITVVLDQVDGLGCFAEIERIAADEAQIELAKQAIEELESRLGLEKKESRSYLGMILELPNR